MNIFRAHKAEWIWLSQEQEIINQYVDFRQEFHINNIDEATESDCQLYISVDTEYAVWINGNFVECNQYDDFPNNKSYDVIDVKRFLREGSNVLHSGVLSGRRQLSVYKRQAGADLCFKNR